MMNLRMVSINGIANKYSFIEKSGNGLSDAEIAGVMRPDNVAVIIDRDTNEIIGLIPSDSESTSVKVTVKTRNRVKTTA
jgi:hypothetical protein